MHAHLLTLNIHHGSRVERIKNDYSTLKAQYDNIKKMQYTQVRLFQGTTVQSGHMLIMY